MTFDTEFPRSRPGLGRLASRLDFAPTTPGAPVTHVTVAPDQERARALGLDLRSHASLDDALTAARELVSWSLQPVAVIRSRINFGEEMAPTFSVTPLSLSGTDDARRGRMQLPAGAPTDILTVDSYYKGYATGDASTMAILTPDWETVRGGTDPVRWTTPDARPRPFPV